MHDMNPMLDIDDVLTPVDDVYVVSYWLPDEMCDPTLFDPKWLDDPDIEAILEAIEDPSHDDITCFCNCSTLQPGHRMDTYSDAHLETCKIHDHKGWVGYNCEWVPHLDAFVYIGEQALIDAGHPAAKTSSGVKATPSQKVKSTGYGEWDYGWNGGGYTYQKCRHYGMQVTFPDGTTIWASSHFSRTAKDSHPDFGVYLASSWVPSNYLSYALPWEDFGLPKVAQHVLLGVVDEILTRAREGQTVEIGCIGGHGRTGTLMALLAMRCGVDPHGAAQWVWDNYCSHAIEGEKQEWFIKHHAALLLGEPLPAPPPPPAPMKKDTPKSEMTADIPDEDDRVGSRQLMGSDCVACGERIDRPPYGYCCNNSGCRGFNLVYRKIDQLKKKEG